MKEKGFVIKYSKLYNMYFGWKRNLIQQGNNRCGWKKKRFVKVLLIDSITTWHMNSHRKRFHQYEPISRGIIYKGNDLALEIVALAPSK